MRKRKGKKKLKGNIDDYPLVIITCSDWTSDASWVSISKAEKWNPLNVLRSVIFSEKQKIKLLPSHPGAKMKMNRSRWSRIHSETMGQEIKHIRVK